VEWHWSGTPVLTPPAQLALVGLGLAGWSLVLAGVAVMQARAFRRLARVRGGEK